MNVDYNRNNQSENKGENFYFEVFYEYFINKRFFFWFLFHKNDPPLLLGKLVFLRVEAGKSLAEHFRVCVTFDFPAVCDRDNARFLRND